MMGSHQDTLQCAAAQTCSSEGEGGTLEQGSSTKGSSIDGGCAVAARVLLASAPLQL